MHRACWQCKRYHGCCLSNLECCLSPAVACSAFVGGALRDSLRTLQHAAMPVQLGWAVQLCFSSSLQLSTPHALWMQAFADAHGFKKAYGSYEDLAADPKVRCGSAICGPPPQGSADLLRICLALTDAGFLGPERGKWLTIYR